MIVPGISALTRTPCGARSTCIDFVSASTAPFEAAYETRRARPVSTIADDTLTIEPERWAIIVGTTARDIRKTPRAFTRITRSHRSSVVSSTSPTPAMPALLKRTSMRLCSATTAAASACVSSSSETSTRCDVPSRSAATTVAPSSANSCADARPIPDAAPVTMQTFLESLTASGSHVWRERAPDPANRLGDPLLVLDEREADESLAVDAEAAAGTDRDLGLAEESQREVVRALVRGHRRPDEHRRARPLDPPVDARQPVAQRVSPALVDRGDLRRAFARLAERDRRRDLQRLEAAVVEVRLEPRQRGDHVGPPEHERDPPARQREALRQRIELDRDLARAVDLEDRPWPVAVEGEVGVSEVVHDHELALACEVDETLKV